MIPLPIPDRPGGPYSLYWAWVMARREILLPLESACVKASIDWRRESLLPFIVLILGLMYTSAMPKKEDIYMSRLLEFRQSDFIPTMIR